MASVELEIDTRAFERKARELGAAVDQVPYALSRAMNDAAFKTRQRLIDETWPQSVNVRNKSFLRAALHVEPSTKHNLEVHVVDQLGRGNLWEHAHGALVRGKGKNVAISIDANVRRGPRGVAKAQRPGALIANTPHRALRITPSGIFVGRHGRLHLMYKLQPTATIKPDVAFVEDFKQFMCEAIETAFPIRLAEAMATRR